MVIRIDEGLFLGNAAAAGDPQFLEKRIPVDDSHPRIAVLNASDERQTGRALSVQAREGRTSFIYHQIPFTDLSHNPMEGEKVWQAVKWMYEMSQQCPILVHCRAGVGRSASLIAAYLRLVRYPNNTYDEVIDMINDVVNKEGHQIFPHIDLPETLSEIQDDEQYRRDLALMIGKESYLAIDEPRGEVQSVFFTDEVRSGHTKTIKKGDAIMVLARVEFRGAEPRGVLLHTSLGGYAQEIPMRARGAGIYHAEVIATQVGDNFWLRISTTIRRHDHPNKRKWASPDMHVVVVEQ